MKFQDKLEARNFLKEKKNNNINLTEEENLALLEFFTEQEIKDSVFITWDFNSCLKDGIDAPTCQPHLDAKPGEPCH